MAIVIVCKATSIIDGGAIDDKGNDIIYTLLHNKYVGKMIATCANYHQTLNAVNKTYLSCNMVPNWLKFSSISL